MAVIVAAVGAGFGLLIGLAWLFQRQLIYLPSAEVPEEDAPPGTEEVELHTEDGLTLDAWFVPGTDDPPWGAVIVFNGNAGNRSHRAPLAEALSEAGMAVLLTDYRGYGGNPGRPSEEGLALDARAALEHVLDRPDVDRVAYFGESLGSAVAVRLATEHRPAGLVLRSPFTSLADVGRHHYPFLPVRGLLHDRYPSADRIERVRSPLLVVAGGRDEVVPTAQSRDLYEAAREAKRFVLVEGAGHNDHALLAGDELIDEVVRFLRGQAGFEEVGNHPLRG